MKWNWIGWSPIHVFSSIWFLSLSFRFRPFPFPPFHLHSTISVLLVFLFFCYFVTKWQNNKNNKFLLFYHIGHEYQKKQIKFDNQTFVFFDIPISKFWYQNFVLFVFWYQKKQLCFFDSGISKQICFLYQKTKWSWPRIKKTNIKNLISKNKILIFDIWYLQISKFCYFKIKSKY